MAKDSSKLTDEEGRLLALLLRTGPASLAELCRVYEYSPVTSFNASRRRLRALLGRLERLGLVAKADAASERLGCSEAGKAAVRIWVMTMSPADLLLEDPLRTKVQSFDLLSREEQLAWAIEAKAALEAHLERLGDYGREVTVPYHGLVHDNAVRSMQARIAWLDRMLATLSRPGSRLN